MINLTQLDIKSFWISFVLAAIQAPIVFYGLQRLNSRQKVSEYAPEGHQAKQGTPTMGGLIMVLTVLEVAYLLNLPWQVLFLFAGFAIIGFIDDFAVPRLTSKRGLGWKQKIILQLIVAVIAVYHSHLNFTFILEVIVILFMSNAYNFSDGLDGLAASLGWLMFLGVFIIVAVGLPAIPSNVLKQNTALALTLQIAPMALLGSLIPFAYLNAPKAKIFMGDVGSLPIGAIYGFAIVEWLTLYPSTWPSIIVLSIPMICELVPVPMQVFWVKTFKKKLFPFTPIHHAFEKAGWPETKVTILFAAVQALCVVISCAIVILQRQAVLTTIHH